MNHADGGVSRLTEIHPFRIRGGITAMSTGGVPAITMYTTTWCGDCRRLKRELSSAGIAFREIGIEGNPSAADYVVRLNGGNQTVPTVVFDDGTVMSEPSGAQVAAHLRSLQQAPGVFDQ